MTVPNEIDLLDFDQLDSWEVYARQPCTGDIQPTVTVMGFERVEILVKIIVPSFAALDLVDPDGAHTDGVAAALHFRGTQFMGAVTSRENASAYHVELVDGRVVETKLPTRFLGKS